jgi:adenylate cyclase class 2
MSTENDIETEVKIRVPGWSEPEAVKRLAAAGFSVTASRIFETNSVYDTPEQAVRSAQMLLRLRRVNERNVLTWKGPITLGPHKSRPELEVTFDSFNAMHQILGHLGYQIHFRYEKYRTEFGGPGGGTVTFDETPIGNFLELEGTGAWIDEMAARLGFKADDYVLESYGRLYLAQCAKEGVQPLNMVFPSAV